MSVFKRVDIFENVGEPRPFNASSDSYPFQSPAQSSAAFASKAGGTRARLDSHIARYSQNSPANRFTERARTAVLNVKETTLCTVPMRRIARDVKPMSAV